MFELVTAALLAWGVPVDCPPPGEFWTPPETAVCYQGPVGDVEGFEAVMPRLEWTRHTLGEGFPTVITEAEFKGGGVAYFPGTGLALLVPLD